MYPRARKMIRKLASPAVLACALLGARSAGAFLIAGTDAAQAPGPETRVVVLREEGRNIVAVAPTVRGPAKALAVVVPLQAGSAGSFHTAPVSLFERADRLAAPKLDELWELDPCELHPDQQSDPPGASASAASSGSAAAGTTVDGDYEISMLQGKDATNAAKWLSDHGYKLADGAADALEAAVKPGWAVAVARIDGARLTFEGDVARLPPLAFEVSGPPVVSLELAAVGASGAHEVVVDVLSPDARMEASNLLNVAVPTNLDLRDDAKGDVEGALRAALDYTFEKTPGAAITQYAWPAASCDGCAPGSGVSAEDLLGLGVERLPSAEDGSLREVTVEVAEALAAAPEGPPELKRQIASCYLRSLGEMRGLAGETTVSVKTGASGEVESTKIQSASAETLGKCVEEAARATKFERPNASGTIQAKFALVARAYVGKMVLSRLRVRAAKGSGDLELRAAAAIEGGREDGPSGAAEQKVYFAEQVNNFRARYVVRHAWPGPIACETPRRGIWGAKPKGYPAATARPAASVSASAAASGAASGKAAASAAERRLASLVEGGALPDLQAYAIAFRAVARAKPAVTAPAPASASSAAPPAPPAASAGSGSGAGGGCGCSAAGASSGPRAWGVVSAAVVSLWAAMRRRLRTRRQTTRRPHRPCRDTASGIVGTRWYRR